MRAIWKGVIAFGLVNIGVRVYSATEDKDIRFNQVHAGCGGRIKMPRACSSCGETGIPVADLAKGWDPGDGNLVILTDEDLADLPVRSSKVIEVQRFGLSSWIDPIYREKTYYLEPEPESAKAYELLRRAIADSVALAKVALRQRERLAVIEFMGDPILRLTTLLWPDEVRVPQFKFMDERPTVTSDELAMAHKLVAAMTGDLDLDEYSDEYRSALEARIEAKMSGRELPQPEPEPQSNVVDLMAALQASIERNKRAKEPAPVKTGRRSTRGAVASK